MRLRHGWVLQVAICAVFACSSSALGDDDDAKVSGAASGTASGTAETSRGGHDQPSVPALNDEQQRAVGILVARPLAARAPSRIEAFGSVLDATLLISEFGERSATEAALHAASAELKRLRGLIAGGAGTSLRALESAQMEEAKARADAESAAARFDLHWGPVAALSPAVREKLLAASASGRSLLVRAELPGLHSLGLLPAKALLDVDGIEVPGDVLGALRQSMESQSVGVLIEVQHAPLGLGPGAHVPIALLTAPHAGLLLPREAIFYDENGSYVYKRLSQKDRDGKGRYAPVKVSLVLPYGDGWLVDGVDDDDDIVVRGAGVLWSLQGVGAHAVDDDD